MSVDVAKSKRIEHSSGPGLKVAPQFLSAEEIAFHVKGGPDEGLAFTSGRQALKRAMRSPAWSPDGSTVVYEKVAFRPVRPLNKPLYNNDCSWRLVWIFWTVQASHFIRLQV